MSAKGKGAKDSIHLKYKKILPKDVQFIEGDKFNEHGTYGSVKKAHWSGKVVAVKCFSDLDRKGGFKDELVFLSLLQHSPPHKHIVEMFGACTDHVPGPFIVLEFAPISLEKVLYERKGDHKYKYTADHVVSWAYQLSAGLDYVHAMDLMHRDIKPSNVLLFNSGRDLKLCDFGTARKLEHTLTNAVGTIRYMAPEVIRGKRYTARCDVFSFAIVVWEMITRTRPIFMSNKNMNHMAIMYAMANGSRPPPIKDIPDVVDGMINSCWGESSEKRPSMPEIKRKLEKLTKYIEMGKPLIQKRRSPGKQKAQEPAQSDVFAESKHTQQSNPDCQQGSEDGTEEDRVDLEGEAKQLEQEPAAVAESSPEGIRKLPPPNAAQPPRFSEGPGHEHRIMSTPERPNDLNSQGAARSGMRMSDLERQVSSPPDIPAQHSTPYSTPEGYFVPSPGVGQQWSGGVNPSGSYSYLPGLTWDRSFSQQQEVVGKELYTDDSQFLEEQERRYQEIEAIMREEKEQLLQQQQQSQRHHQQFITPAIAPVGSQYSIPGLDTECQPYTPNEHNQESMALYENYKAVAKEVIQAREDYNRLMEESKKLEEETKKDEEAIQRNRAVLQEYQAQCNERDILIRELEILKKQLQDFNIHV